MTLPKGHDNDRAPKRPPKQGMSKGKKVGAGVGGAVAVLVALGAIGASNQSNNSAELNAPTLRGTIGDAPGQANELGVDIAVVRETITRGSTQEIRFAVFDDNGVVGGANISGKVLYAGGHEELFGGTSDSVGMYTFAWEIGGNSNPGRFTVVVTATHDGRTADGSTVFDVEPA